MQYAQAQRTNPAALALMFAQQNESSLYLPERLGPSFQVVAADVDQDGDEDKYAIRYLGLTDAAGKSLAAGASGDLEIEPQKWCQPLQFLFLDEHSEGIVVTGYTIGQDPQFPTKANAAVIPLGLWARDAENSLIDAGWVGPNTPLIISLKNTGASTKVVYGGAKVRVIVG